jgi:3-hydroxyisobutyrate dehydrogenase-like beta-hydroxyacid dehydrogenase
MRIRLGLERGRSYCRSMAQSVSIIGFGEAGQTFAVAGGWGANARAFDLRDMVDAYACAGVTGCVDSAAAISGADCVLSLVTADQALSAAEISAKAIAQGALYFDMNSVAPDTKRSAAKLVEAAGGRYIDVAIMAPVDPARLAVPLLLSGPHAEAGATMLQALGFANVRALGGEVGQASAIKMIRSVMVKGIEALTAEMMLAADKAGVTDEVLASLGGDWIQKAAYNLERMTTHGLRRAAEMEEVAKTLTALGVEPLLTTGTIVRQREMAQ